MKNDTNMMENTNQKVITRFAPSPTGFMHVGGVRTALYAWLLARKYNGKFILRIEDTDKKREVEGSIEHIIKSLRWLGIDWDEGPEVGGPNEPYIQSERLSIYKKYAMQLLEKGFAYADSSSEEDIEKLRQKAEEEKQPFLFRNYRPENPPEWNDSISLRFKVPELKRYTWSDAVWGDLSAGPEALDDFILIKSDGYPTYNFAHVIDDILMGVTHVMRGQEFIASVPKYLSLYEALGVTPPIFATTPPIMGEGGKKKLGKRDGAKDILEYKNEGYLPQTMINFLALLGWNPGGDREVFSKDELISIFSLEKIQRSGAQFNDDKLDWLNKEHMKMMSENERNNMILERLLNNPEINESDKISDKTYISKLYPIIFDRISKLEDLDIMVREGELSYFFAPPVYEKSLLVWKDGNMDETLKHLKYVISVLTNSPDDVFENVEKIKSLIFDYATDNGRGQVLWPVRVALSGREKSPDPFTLIHILGKNESIERLTKAIEK
jgi:glutamyl-tRNA synthetase